MKYILNEDIRQILEERFILNEDASTIVNDLKRLWGILTNYIKWAPESKAGSDDTKNIETARQELAALNTSINNSSKGIFQKAINKLANQVLKSSDIARIKGTTKEVVQRVESLLDASSIAGKEAGKNPDGTSFTVKEYLRQIKILAASDDVSKETALKIKENVAKITNIVNNLSQAKTENSKANKDLIKIAQDALMSAHNLQDLITKVGGADKFAALDSANNLMSLVTTILKNHDNKQTADEQRQNLIDFSNLTTKVINASGITLDTSRANTIDWDSRFAQANDKQIFWNSYYEKAWGSNSSKIRALGDPFRNQCEKLGFTEKTNPFITFVKKYIIEKNYPISGNVYTAIHNAVATGKVDQTLLNGTAGDKLNILACKDLYTKSAKEVTSYLDFFNAVYKESELDPNTLFSIDIDNITDENRKEKFAAVISHLNRDDKSKNQIAWLLLFDTIEFTDRILLTKPSSIKLAPYTNKLVETTSLRKTVEIQAIIKILAPDVADISTQAFTKDTLQALIAKMPKANATNTQQIGQWILVMIGQFLAPEAEEQILRDYPKLTTIELSPADRAKYKKQILEFGNNMTKDQIINILIAYENGVDGKEETKVSFK